MFPCEPSELGLETNNLRNEVETRGSAEVIATLLYVLEVSLDYCHEIIKL